MTREYTALFDYQEFCELLDHIQVLRSLAIENKKATPMYREKIKQICERVERDFNDSHHFFSGWVNGKSILLESGYIVSLNGDRKVIFVFLILNRRRELGLPIFQSDLEQFCKLCKQARVVFPRDYFAGV